MRDWIAWIAVAAVLLFALRLIATARRLDRIHRRVAASRASLDAQLSQRASCAARLAASGQLDPASSVILAEEAWAALAAGGDAPVPGAPPVRAANAHPAGGHARMRSEAESDLSRALRQVFDDESAVAAMAANPDLWPLVDDLAAAWFRVQIARRFHNEAVAQARHVRRKRLVRVFALAGRAPMPISVEFDDAWPDGLPRPDGAA